MQNKLPISESQVGIWCAYHKFLSGKFLLALCIPLHVRSGLNSVGLKLSVKGGCLVEQNQHVSQYSLGTEIPFHPCLCL